MATGGRYRSLQPRDSDADNGPMDEDDDEEEHKHDSGDEGSSKFHVTIHHTAVTKSTMSILCNVQCALFEIRLYALIV